MPTSKSPKKSPFPSPIFCCNCALRAFYNPLLQAVFLSAIFVLILTAVIFIVCGAVYAANSVALCVVGAILLSLAAALASVYIWMRRRRFCKKKRICNHAPNSISTIRISDYYSQMPPGKKTDFPMGPHLIMTLPRPSRARTRRGSSDSGDKMDDKSIDSLTPASIRINRGFRAKNVPPLASEETLSPSLDCSSYGSIDSVV